MKYVLAAAALITFSACGDSAKTAEVSESQQVSKLTGTTYVIDSTSKLTWKGSKPTGTHTGTFNLSGELTVDGKNITAGTFTIDVASLVNQDLTEKDGKSKLEGHLKSPDFFDVQKYPTAKFEITGIKP